MANGNFMHGFLNDMEMGEEIDPSTILDTIIEEVVDANNEVIESSKDLEALTNANTELTEINNEMDVALESNAGPAVMRLVLNRYANLKSKLGIPASGLEADSKNLDVTADDVKNAKEESKGIFAKIGDFISKVWKAIKDGIAKVWSKMKEFWAWLTGKNKKAQEQMIKSEIAISIVAVAADTQVDLEDKEELSKAVTKNFETKGILNIFNVKEFDAKKFDEMMKDPTTVISLDTLKEVRAEPVKSKQLLIDLMNEKLASESNSIIRQFLLVLPLSYNKNKDGSAIFKLEKPTLEKIDLELSFRDTPDAKKISARNVNSFLRDELNTTVFDQSLYYTILYMENDILNIMSEALIVKKNEIDFLCNAIEEEVKSPGKELSAPFVVDYNYVLYSRWDDKDPNKLNVGNISILDGLPSGIDTYQIFKDSKDKLSWSAKNMFFNSKTAKPIITNNDKVIKTINNTLNQSLEAIDNAFKLVDKNTNGNVPAYTSDIVKLMAKNSGRFLGTTLTTAMAQTSNLLTMIVDILDSTSAIAKLDENK